MRHVFLTHHHSDHNADYGTLLSLVWVSGLTTPIDTWGPPPLAATIEAPLDNERDLIAALSPAEQEQLAGLLRKLRLGLPSR